MIDATTIEPTVTWGTSPEDTVPIGGVVPDPASFADPTKQKAARASLDYMGLEPGQRMDEVEVQNVFIGSCTNSRIEDLRAAAAVLKGRHKAPGVKWAIVVPGSGLVKAQAEAEGLDKVFTEAGLEWREPGCSACLGMNPDKVPPGERCASTSNRNFVGRQGPGARTHLVSPAMAAAAAVTGKLTDVRELVWCSRSSALVDRSRLRPGLARQGEAGFDGQRGIGDVRRHAPAHGRAVLEAVPRAAADQPDPLVPGQAVDQEIAVRAVLVLADPAVDERRVGEPGEALREIGPGRRDAFGGHAPVLRVRIDLGPVPVEGELEALPLQFRHAVDQVAGVEIGPDRQFGRGEPRCRRAAAPKW